MPSRAAVRGFSIIELMITVALAGIMAAIAAPAMTKVFRSNRVQTETAALASDMQFARSEAVKRGQSVSLCASSDGATCLGANTWDKGWIIFFDPAGNGAWDSANDTVLRVRKPFVGGDTLAASPSATSVTFNREGFTSNLGTSLSTFQLHTSDGDSAATRCVVLNISGRLKTHTAGQGSCS